MMSDKNNVNPFSRVFQRLFGSPSQAKQVDKPSSESASLAPAPAPTALPQDGLPKTGGLTPLDLLSLPSDQGKLVNWLTHKQNASFSEIQEGLGLDSAEVTRVLDKLKSSDYVRETIVDGVIRYSVIFRASTSRRRSTSTLDSL